eukprot:scaffold8079_cov444-Prasinococcus_capsulatus_cf.AAC.1
MPLRSRHLARLRRHRGRRESATKTHPALKIDGPPGGSTKNTRAAVSIGQREWAWCHGADAGT